MRPGGDAVQAVGAQPFAAQPYPETSHEWLLCAAAPGWKSLQAAAQNLC
jgi:hypothetical protein